MGELDIQYQRHWQRRDTAANLAARNEVLYSGEWCYETDTGLTKIGDGVTPYNDLPYKEVLFAIATGDNTIAATFPSRPVLIDGTPLLVRAAAANTGAVTLSANGIAALAVTKQGGIPLAAGDIAGAGHELSLRYVAAVPPRYELLNPAGGTATGAVGITFGSVTADAALPVGAFVDFPVTKSYTLTGPWQLKAYPAGSITIDVRKAAFPSDPLSSIVTSGGPATASSGSATGSITYTSPVLAIGDMLRVHVLANSGVKWFSLLLNGTRT